LKRTTLINKMKKLGITRPSHQRIQHSTELAAQEDDLPPLLH
jgi:hypothetical protein